LDAINETIAPVRCRSSHARAVPVLHGCGP